MASTGPYASLHLAPDRQPGQHPTTQFFTGRMPFLPPNQQRQSTEGTLLSCTLYKNHSQETLLKTRIMYIFLKEDMPSVLWHCWLGVKKSIWPVKIEWQGVGVAICLSEVPIVCIWSSWCHCIPKPTWSHTVEKKRYNFCFNFKLRSLRNKNYVHTSLAGWKMSNVVTICAIESWHHRVLKYW